MRHLRLLFGNLDVKTCVHRFAILVFKHYEDENERPKEEVEDQEGGNETRRDWRFINTVNRVCSGVKKVRSGSFLLFCIRRDTGTDPRSRLRHRTESQTMPTRAHRRRSSSLPSALYRPRDSRSTVRSDEAEGLDVCEKR